MNKTKKPIPVDEPADTAEKPLHAMPPAALRALAEAEARRASPPARPPELNGRGGLDPVRYGDWEVKGLASDF